MQRMWAILSSRHVYSVLRFFSCLLSKRMCRLTVFEKAITKRVEEDAISDIRSSLARIELLLKHWTKTSEIYRHRCCILISVLNHLRNRYCTLMAYFAFRRSSKDMGLFPFPRGGTPYHVRWIRGENQLDSRRSSLCTLDAEVMLRQIRQIFVNFE